MAIALEGDGGAQTAQAATNNQDVQRMLTHGHFTLSNQVTDKLQSIGPSPPGCVEKERKARCLV